MSRGCRAVALLILWLHGVESFSVVRCRRCPTKVGKWPSPRETDCRRKIPSGSLYMESSSCKYEEPSRKVTKLRSHLRSDSVFYMKTTVVVAAALVTAFAQGPNLPSLLRSTTAVTSISFVSLCKNVWCGLLRNLGAFSKWYFLQISQRPVFTKCLTAMTLGFLGDVAAQSYERKSRGTQDYDKRRGMAIATESLFISGPLLHYSYELFESVLPASTSALAALTHVIADTLILDSIFVASAQVVSGVLEGMHIRQVWSELRKDYLSALKISWCASLVLLPAEFVCFRYLPLALRVLSVNVLDIVWDATISFAVHRGRARPIATDYS